MEEIRRMPDKILNTKIILRNDTKNNWEINNPILLQGELGVEIDTQKFKFGDNITNWNLLPYASSSSAIIKTVDPQTTDTEVDGHEYDIGSIWVNETDGRSYILNSITGEVGSRVAI